MRKLECFGPKTWVELKDLLRDVYSRPCRSLKSRGTRGGARYVKQEVSTQDGRAHFYLPHLLRTRRTGPENLWQLVKDPHEIIGELSKEEEYMLQDILSGV